MTCLTAQIFEVQNTNVNHDRFWQHHISHPCTYLQKSDHPKSLSKSECRKCDLQNSISIYFVLKDFVIKRIIVSWFIPTDTNKEMVLKILLPVVFFWIKVIY